MRKLTILGIQILAASVCYGQARPIIGQQLAWPPPSGTAMFNITPTPGALPTSLKDLLSKSSLVVDASVQEVLPARAMESRRLETDVKIKINTVLKGSPPSQPIVIAQFGGSIGSYTEHTAQYDVMRAGEHYILFLSEDSRSGIAPIAGTLRLLPTGIWVGLFRILADNTINLPAATPAPLRQLYQEALLDQLIKDIDLAAVLP